MGIYATKPSRFGFGTHDQNNFPIIMALLFDGVQVGSLSNSPPNSDLFQQYFKSPVTFNAITISQPGAGSGYGFMLDKLTMEISIVPEPASLTLLAFGLAGIGWDWLGLAGIGWDWLGLAGIGWDWLGLAGIGFSRKMKKV